MALPKWVWAGISRQTTHDPILSLEFCSGNLRWVQLDVDADISV